MPSRAPISILSNSDPSILNLFTPVLSAETTAPAVTQAVTEISRQVVRAFLRSQTLPASVTLIPVLRAGLPMYVAASPLFPNSNTALVTCSKDDKSKHGRSSVRLEWMGNNPVEAARSSAAFIEQRIIILDSILATGATLLKLCDELSNISGLKRQVTVLCCYASPEGLAAVAAHEVVHSIVVAHRADTINEHGYVVPWTHGDLGDKLFGEKSSSGKCVDDAS